MRDVLKKVLNLGEDRVRRQIVPAADRYGGHVHSKIRVADAINIDGLGRGLRSYALMAHLDFVVSDEAHRPHFALEFDGPGHDPTHDAKKDEICRYAGLALFRVNLPMSNSKIGQLTFLNYLVHLWFLALKFEEMQRIGEIPQDEAFMISGFLRSDAKNIFDSEFDLLGPARGKINAFCKRENMALGALSHMRISELMLGNECGQYVAFSSFPIDDTKLYGRATLGLKVPNLGRLKEVQFSKQELGQYCTALAINELFEELKLFRAGLGHILRRRDEVQDEIEILLNQGFSSLLALSAGDDELVQFVYRRQNVAQIE